MAFAIPNLLLMLIQSLQSLYLGNNSTTAEYFLHSCRALLRDARGELRTQRWMALSGITAIVLLCVVGQARTKKSTPGQCNIAAAREKIQNAQKMKAYIIYYLYWFMESKFLIFFVCICFHPPLFFQICSPGFKRTCWFQNYAAQVMFSAAFFCSILVLVPRSQFWNQHQIAADVETSCFFFQRLTFRFHKFEAWNPPSNTGDHRWGSASSATLDAFGIVSSVSIIYILFDSFELIHKGQESPSQMSYCPGYREKYII